MVKHPRRKSKKSKVSFEKRVLKVINKSSEKKNLDQLENATSIVSGTPFNMNIGMPAQGDTDLTRDGDQIRVTNIWFRGELSLKAPATEGALFRLIVLRIPATNVDGTAPISDFTSMTPNGFFPRELPYKYRIYKDVTYSLGVGEKNKRLVKIKIPVMDIQKFDGTLSTDVTSFRIAVLGVTEHATASELTMEANTRMNYYDS